MNTSSWADDYLLHAILIKHHNYHAVKPLGDVGDKLSLTKDSVPDYHSSRTEDHGMIYLISAKRRQGLRIGTILPSHEEEYRNPRCSRGV